MTRNLISRAQTMAINRSSHLNAGITGTRYTTWFGRSNPMRYGNDTFFEYQGRVRHL